MKIASVIVAAGSGTRFNAPKPKAFVSLGGRPLASYSLSTFQGHPEINKIVLVVPSNYKNLQIHGVLIAVGGETRQDSVANGLALLDESDEAVLIHDAARPFVTSLMIDQLLLELKKGNHAIVAVKVMDTLKQVEGDQILKTVDRGPLWAAQTPQAFLLAPLKDALNRAKENGWLFTDEAALLEKLNIPVHFVEGEASNLKITTPRDLEFAEGILEWKKKKR